MLRRRRKEERSASGSPILRHQASDRGFEPATSDDPAVRDAVEAHLERHLGECDLVLHEIVSDLVHVDVYLWEPTAARRWYTLATDGMSDLPMRLPREAVEAGVAARAELVLCLPPDWPVPTERGSTTPWTDESYFPVSWLKQLARLPHEYGSWLGFGHTVPNGDPAAPFATGTALCGWVLLPPLTLPSAASEVELDGGRVDLFGIVALHQDEMDHKLAHGVDALFDGFERHGVSELLDVDRPSSLSG